MNLKLPVSEPLADRVAYHGPMCRCGSRNTKRVGDPFQFLARDCQDCGNRYYYRIYAGGIVPFIREFAEILDEERECLTR